MDTLALDPIIVASINALIASWDARGFGYTAGDIVELLELHLSGELEAPQPMDGLGRSDKASPCPWQGK